MADLGSFGSALGGLFGGLAQGAEAGISLGQKQQQIDLQRSQQGVGLLNAMVNMRRMPLEMRKIVMPGILQQYEKAFGAPLPKTMYDLATKSDDDTWGKTVDALVTTLPKNAGYQELAQHLKQLDDPEAQLKALDLIRKMKSGESLGEYRQGTLGLRTAGTTTTTSVTGEGVRTTERRPNIGAVTPAVPGATPTAPTVIPQTTTQPATKDDLNNPTTWVKSSLANLDGPQRADFMKRLADDKDYQSAISAYKDDPTDEESKNIIQTKIRDHFNAVKGPEVEKRGPGYEIQKPTQMAEIPTPLKGDATKKGEAYLATLPPGMQQNVQSIAEYRAKPVSRSTPQGAAIMSAVEKYRKDAGLSPYDETQYGAINKITGAMASGPLGNNITSYNMTLSHLGNLTDSMRELNNAQLPGANAFKNWLQTAAGQKAVTNFKINAEAVATEMMKVFRGNVGPGADAEIQRIKATLNPNMSEAQFKGAVQQFMNLLEGRIEAAKGQYEAVKGGKADADRFLYPRTKPAIAKIQAYAGSAPPLSTETPPPGTPTPGTPPPTRQFFRNPKNGLRIYSDDGKTWFNENGTPYKP